MLPRALARRGALAAAMRRPRRAARASGAAARGCSSLRVVIRGLLVLPGRLGPWEAFCRGLLAGHANHACGSPGAARKTACPDPFHRFGLRPLPVGLRRAGRRPLHSMPGRRALLLLTLTRQTTTTTTTTTTATTTRKWSESKSKAKRKAGNGDHDERDAKSGQARPRQVSSHWRTMSVLRTGRSDRGRGRVRGSCRRCAERSAD